MSNLDAPASVPSGNNAAVDISRGRRASTHPNLILEICCMSLLVVGMDVTIVNVALPQSKRTYGLLWRDFNGWSTRTRSSSPAC